MRSKAGNTYLVYERSMSPPFMPMYSVFCCADAAPQQASAASGGLYAVPTAKAIGELCQRMGDLFPALAHAHVIRFWSGVEGSLPDHHPIIGPSPTTPQLIHAFGFSGAGFQIGPAVGEALAELVHHGRSSVALDAFSITRFNPASSSTQGAH